MKICNVTGVGICVNCNGIPPATDGYNHGEVCRKTAQKIMDVVAEIKKNSDKPVLLMNACPDRNADMWKR